MNNQELLTFYNAIQEGDDDAKQEAITEDFSLLQKIQEDPLMCHENTKFHCSGHPFSCTQYRETDWTIRLHYSLKDQLPSNVYLRKSYAYGTNFPALQEIYSLQPSPVFFYFRGAPDFIFTTKKSSGSVCMYEDDIVELKHDKLPVPKDRVLNLPNAVAQLIGGLHFLAVAKVTRCIMDRSEVPEEFYCRGILIKRKDQMTLYTLSVNLGTVMDCKLEVTSKDLHTNGTVLTLGHVCKALAKLYE